MCEKAPRTHQASIATRLRLCSPLPVVTGPFAAACCHAHRSGLQPLESFLVKAIQLYEMIVVRHGLMLVGQSYGMKTSVYRTLAAALTGECAGVLEHKVGLVYASSPSRVVWHGSLAPRRTACMRERLLVLTRGV